MTAQQTRTLFRAAGIISIALVASRLLGYVREALLAARFGATHTTDAYLVAQDLPMSLFAAVGAALTMVFIPVYRDVVTRRGEAAGWRLTNSVLNLTLLLALVLLALGLAVASPVVRLLVPGLPAQYIELAVALTRTMLPMLLFMGLSGVAAAVLNANRHFTAPALTGLMNNVPVVAVLLVASGPGHIHWVAWAVLAGAAAGALVQVPWLPKLGYKYEPVLDLKDPGLAQMGRLILPVLVTSVAIQFHDSVDRFLASGLAEGSISALNYAVRVNSLPYGVIGAAIATVLYPTLAEDAAADRLDNVRNTLARGLRTLAWLLLPMSLGLVIFREEIVALIFQRGAFDPRATAATAYALQFYAVGILFFGWQDFLNRCFFALQDTLTPMWAAVGFVALNVGFKLALVGPLAHGGLALGTGLSAAASVGFLLWRLRRRLGRLGGREVLRSVGANVGTTLLGVLAGYAVHLLAARLLPGSGLTEQAVRLGLSLGTIVVVHVGLALLLGSREGAEVAGRLLRRR